MSQIKIRNCCVPSCKETHVTSESFFRFPNDSRDRKRWKSAIGFPQNFEPNPSTFVCIKHFMERDIAQRADRKTGQKARLKILSTPRLFLEPIKEEVLKKAKEQNANTTPSAKQAVTEEQPKETAAEEVNLVTLIGSLRDRLGEVQDGKRKRAKISKIMAMLQVAELYSSDSDCEYEINLTKKKRKQNNNETIKENTENVTPLSRLHSEASINGINDMLNTNNIESNQLEINRSTINNSAVSSIPEPPTDDDFEDALTPTVIPKQPPKNTTNTSPNVHPKKRGYIPSPERQPYPLSQKSSSGLILPPKKNYSNIMVASINADGEIVEQIEELVTGDPPVQTESQEDLNQLIEVDFSGQIEDQTACNLPPAELLQDDQNSDTTDDELADGIVRTCYECTTCKEMSLSARKTIRHLKQAHSLVVKIEQLKHFTNQYPFKNFRMVNGVRAFTCSVCLMLYYNVQSLKKHQTMMHAPLLGLGLTSQSSSSKKVSPVANDYIHLCHVCQKSFLNPENLRSHLLLHVDTKIGEVAVYKCDQCGLGFEYEAALTKHTVEHHQTVRLYTCEYCNDAFSTGSDLIEHVQHHLIRNDQTLSTATEETLKLSELVLACPEDNCNMQFKESNDYYSHILYQHRKVYQDDPKFIEYIQMVDPETLDEKRNKGHTTTQKFSCRICDRKFTHYSFLKAHEAGKNKFKYECSECDEKTPSKVCLIRHYNVRHDKNIERLHFCTDCPKSFPRKAQLLSHISTHRSDGQSNIFHCNLDGCDRIFADQTTYHFHLSRLHPNAKNVGALVCKYPNCSARFRHDTMLKQHIVDEHLPANVNNSSTTKNTRHQTLNNGDIRVVNSNISTSNTAASGEAFSRDTNTKDQNIFFGHSEKFDEHNVNGTMDLNIPDSLMLNDVCNEVTIYTDF